MEVLSEFIYLGRLLKARGEDWRAVDGNTKKARQSWGRLARVIGREGDRPQGVTDLLHHQDTGGTTLRVRDLSVDGKMKKALDTFQARVARKLTGRHP